MKRRFILVLCFLAAAAGVFASEALAGRDYVRLGKLGSVTGTLRQEAGEWYLRTPNLEYAIHLGNYGIVYPEGISLESGSSAEVKGFIYENHVSAVSVTSDGKTWNFRDQDGRPAWAGGGRGRNEYAPNGAPKAE